MFEFLNQPPYSERVVDRTNIGNVIVSTAHTIDHGYETAIIDKNGAHPVERYKTREEAEAGHMVWCLKADTIKTVTELGWLDLVKDSTIEISHEKWKE